MQKTKHMKKIYALLLLMGFCASAQVINFPDPAFKAKLLSATTGNQVAYSSDLSIVGSVGIDTNANGEIEQSEAALIGELRISNSGISDLTGIEYFTNLWTLTAADNQITAVDFNNMPKLNLIYLPDNQITTFYRDLENFVMSGSNIGFRIGLYNNPLQSFTLLNSTQAMQTEIQLSEVPEIMQVTGPIVEMFSINSQAAVIEIPLPNILTFSVIQAPNANAISTRNGAYTILHASGVPQLEYICTDEIGGEEQIIQFNFPGKSINTLCYFMDGAANYTAEGNIRYDGNGNGCDAADLIFAHAKFNLTSGSVSGEFIADGSGHYNIPLDAATHTITPYLENANYYTITPTSVTVEFPADASPNLQDFCITPNGSHTDIEVAMVPGQMPARPGFDSEYKLIYKNKGTVAANGIISLSHENTVSFVSAQPNVSAIGMQVLSWSFTDLEPFEQREIAVTMKVNAPTDTPAVNGGDVLHYFLNGNTDISDSTPDDNYAFLNQTAVNSFDPNDKTCLDGNAIAPDQVGKYVHYQIRFENTGTANAENIVVRDVIDADKFDISTLIPMDGSHHFTTRIDGNTAAFVFENIQLPFDDANNDGYLMFKIKTNPNLAIGDSFSNSASIFFDYNHAIVTDPAVTTIQLLGKKDFEFASEFALYPNPTAAILNIQSKGSAKVQSINIYNTLGQLVLVVTNAETVSKIDVSDLASGNYFLKITSDKGNSNVKFVKN